MKRTVIDTLPKLIPLIGLIVGILTSCTQEPLEPKHYYFILSPTNPDQIKQARALLGNAEDLSIKSDNSYTVLELCASDEPTTLVSRIDLKDKAHIDSVTAEAFKSLTEKEQGNITLCTASLKSLEKALTMLSHAAKQQKKGRLVAFIQAPWSVKADDDTLGKIKMQAEALQKSNQVDNVVLFGLDKRSALAISSSFEPLAKDGKFHAAVGIPELIVQMKTIQ